jgi:UDP-glucose 4-epimerase
VFAYTFLSSSEGVHVVWLVTGGAGYVGAHVVRDLLEFGFDVEVLDDLSTGIAARVPDSVDIHVCDLRDRIATKALIDRTRPEGVVHLAGMKQARESYTKASEYWSTNVLGTVSSLDALVDVGTTVMLFTSSCSVYGSQAAVTERSALAPASPYGKTKVTAEMVIRDVSRITPMRAVSLRYFNVIGCAQYAEAHDVASESVVLSMMNAALQNEPLPVCGTDRSTPDGSCLRDYIDVRDIARAHSLIAQALASGIEVAPQLNASTGRPTSVLEMARAINAVLDRPLDALDIQRSHPADPSEVWASPSQFLRALGWQAQHSLKESIDSHLSSVRAQV